MPLELTEIKGLTSEGARTSSVVGSRARPTQHHMAPVTTRALAKGNQPLWHESHMHAEPG
jgi:hypothetical protein